MTYMIKQCNYTRQVWKPNPDYSTAPFELVCIDESGNHIPDGQPMRFSADAVCKAIEYMHKKEWVKLRMLSIPSHMPAFE